MSVQAHKQIKGLKTENLRDHMSEAELIFTALAELSTRQIAESVAATGMGENKIAAKTGGRIAKKARLELEARPGSRSLPEQLSAAAAPHSRCEEQWQEEMNEAKPERGPSVPR